ncbi:MAG: hypothetical protein K6F78_06450 [Bacteroidaceae bacterium]|nr:hypothetical protein [Bacteroidaceae bacterium]
MCTLNVKMDDQIVNRMRPLFDGDKAMNVWIETVLHKAMVEYADEVESRNMKEIDWGWTRAGRSIYTLNEEVLSSS